MINNCKRTYLISFKVLFYVNQFAHFVGFEVFTVVAIENIIFCDMA